MGNPKNRAKITHDKAAFKAWIEEITPNKKEKTLRVFSREVLRFLEWHRYELCSKDFEELTYQDMGDYTAFLQNPKPESHWYAPARGEKGAPKQAKADYPQFRGKGLSIASVNVALSALSNFFGYLVKCGYLSTTPIYHATIKHQYKEKDDADKKPEEASKEPKPVDTVKIAEERKVERFLPESAVAQIFSASEHAIKVDPKNRKTLAKGLLLYTLLYFQCMRCEEATDLLSSDFRRKDTGWAIYVKGKGDSKKTIQVEKMVEVMIEKIAQYIDVPVVPMMYAEQPPRYVLQNRSGNKLTYLAAYRLFNRHFNLIKPYMDESWLAQMDGFSPHWLRHSGATHCLEKGYTINEVSALLRHANIATTMTYIHNENRQLAEAMKRVNREFVEG